MKSVVEAPPCLLDDVSRKLIPLLQRPGQPGQAMAQVHALAELAMVDIASVEARHAAIRRALEGTSVHTWRATLAKISADWMIRQTSARRQTLSRRLFWLTRRKKKPGRKRKSSKQKGFARGGGGQRAFFREKLLEHGSQQKTNMAVKFREMHLQFKRLSHEQRAYYEEIGAAATMSSKSGHQAFGEKRYRTQQKKLAKARACSSGSTVHLKQLNSRGKAAAALMLPAVRGASGANALAQIDLLESTIANRKRVAVHQRALASSKRQKGESRLRSWARERLGQTCQDEPLFDDDPDTFEQVLSPTVLPRPFAIPNCSSWEVFPPNMKLTKDWVSQTR